MSNNNLRLLLIADCWLLTALLLSLPVYADPPTNGTITLTQDTLSGSGGTVGSGNPMRIISSVGHPLGGIEIAGGMTLIAGYPAGGLVWPPGERLIDVQGTINDPTASIVVNGVAATLTGTTFLAHEILLVEGWNTITATATDPAGHVATHTIEVRLDTQPPAMPTVAEHLAVTALGTNSHLLTGTKQAGTSVWMNGVMVVGPTASTTWSYEVTGLLEGDNIREIVTRDAAGNVSATVTINLIVDNLPPVISNLAYVDVNNQPLNPDPTTSLPKTNFTPVTITGQVDDSLTQIVLNGVTAARAGQHFEVTVPLAVVGTNPLTLVATSPNNHVTTEIDTVMRGTIPSILSVQPVHGSKRYVEQPTTIHVTATDAENDPLEYQIRLDGTVVQNWSGSPSYGWTPPLAQLGPHTIDVRARDAFGGYASQQPHVYVLRHPVSPP